MTFRGIVEKFETGTWTYHIPVPMEIAERFVNSETGRRIVCYIDDHDARHCALSHDGLGGWVIFLHKVYFKKYNLKHKQEVSVRIEADTSKYGMPVPPEFEEVLIQDPEALAKFELLTPGMQRSLIYYVAQVKTSDIRLRRAIVIAEHIKIHDKPDGRVLMQEMREANRRFK